jgi:colanic acid/amylovoran biosynthesis glycosyltransferase
MKGIDMRAPPRKVLYVVSRFPALTTTFSALEMATLRELGIEIKVASAWASTDSDRAQTIERPFLPGTIQLSLLRWRLWTALARALVKDPTVLKLFFLLLEEHGRSLYTLLKLLVSFPKGAYLAELALEAKCDHIHAHFLSSPATIALVASHISRIPYTVTVHAFDIFSGKPQELNASIRLKCERAAACILISQFNFRYMRSRWPSMRARSEVIYNGIDTEMFKKPSLEKPARDTFIVLSNGRLVETKGHSILISAVGALVKRGYNIHLRIIGSGPIEQDLRQLSQQLGIAGNVSFLGTMPQEEVVRNYALSDLFALACVPASDGDMDGLPVVLCEAMSMEIPVVSTRLSGIPELVEDQVTGLCVPPNDINALSGAIEFLINNPDVAERLASAGRQRVLERFERFASARRLIAVWQSIDPSNAGRVSHGAAPSPPVFGGTNTASVYEPPRRGGGHDTDRTGARSRADISDDGRAERLR